MGIIEKIGKSLAFATAIVATAFVVRNNHFPERLWNDHGDVALNPQQLTDNEFTAIARFFMVRDDGFRANLSHRDFKSVASAEKELTNRMKIGTFEERQFYLTANEALDKRYATFVVPHYDEQTARDAAKMILIEIPAHYFKEPKIVLGNLDSFTFNGKGADIFLMDIVPKLSELLRIGVTQREGVLETALRKELRLPPDAHQR